MEIIQDPFFVGGPEGGDEVFFGAVAGDPVDHDVFRENVDALLQPLSVRFQAQAGEFPFGVFCLQVRAPEHMEQVKFHTVTSGSFLIRTGSASAESALFR